MTAFVDLLTVAQAAGLLQPHVPWNASEWLADLRRTEPRYPAILKATKLRPIQIGRRVFYRPADLKKVITELSMMFS